MTRHLLRLRMRADLEARSQQHAGRPFWIVKDPVALRYYRFADEEYGILEMLDGETSVESIQQRFADRYGQKLTADELQRFVGAMHRASLVVSDAPGQGRELRLRGDHTARARRWLTLGSLLSLRLPGFDPDRVLRGLNAWLGWIFSGPAVVCGLGLAIAAGLLLLAQWDACRARLPGLAELFAGSNWIWLAVVLATTKVLHEFGHGLTCKRFGGECHEMGVLLLVFTPCLYCDVSDSWMLPSKWRRMGIAAAGMYVELLLASLATFLWWFSQPGLIHSLSLNVMFVCSVSTLVFNANPLLRLDGYYILSDLVEIPNLRQKANALLIRMAGAWFCGWSQRPDPLLPHRRQIWLVPYAIAAVVYRWFVTFSILLFLARALEPSGFQVLGQLLATLAVAGMLLPAALHVARFCSTPGRLRSVRKIRLLVAVAVVGVFSGLMFVPVPFHVRCTFHIQPRAAEAVYVEVPGTIGEIHARAGDRVERGQPLLTLTNLDVQLTLAELTSQRAQLIARREGLERQAYSREAVLAEQAQIREAILAVETQLKKRRRDLERLSIVAPVAGFVFATPSRTPGDQQDGRLATWSGRVLEPHNLGAHLSDGVAVCQLGEPRELEATLAIDQSEVEFVRPGQTVDLVLDQLPTERFASRIDRLARVDMEVSPQSLSHKSGGELVTRTDQAGYERPVSTTYLGAAALDDPDERVVIGATGHARIRAGSRTMAQRLWRTVCQTFRLP